MTNLLVLNLVFTSSAHSNWVRGGHGTYTDTIQMTFRTEDSFSPEMGRMEI